MQEYLNDFISFYSALDEQDAKEIMHIEERYIATMQRSISCTTLAMADFSANDPYEQGRNYSANKGIFQFVFTKMFLNLSDITCIVPQYQVNFL